MVGLWSVNRNSVLKSPMPSAPNSFASLSLSKLVMLARILISFPALVLAILWAFHH